MPRSRHQGYEYADCADTDRPATRNVATRTTIEIDSPATIGRRFEAVKLWNMVRPPADRMCSFAPDCTTKRHRILSSCLDRCIKPFAMYASVQTSKHLSATRSPSGALWTATSRERGRKNEIPDYFLFVTWTSRLLRRRPVCERRRLRSHGGFGRMCPFSGAGQPYRPVVQPTGRESVRVELIAAHYPALTG
jgi:hypothetical protein